MDVNKRILLLTGALWSWNNFIAPTTLQAQMNRFRTAPATSSLLTSPSRELQSLLSDAEKSIAAKEWSDATLALGRILGIEKSQEFSSEEFGVDRFYGTVARELGGDGKEIRGSLFQHIYKLLDDAPDEAIQILEVRHGVEAKQAIQAAIESSDWKAIERLSSLYGFLAVGQDARMLLADLSLARGDTFTAASLLDGLLTQRRARDRFGAPLGLLAAQTHLLVGNQARAKTILQQTIQSHPSFRGSLGAFPEIEWTTNNEPNSTIDKLVESLVPKSTQPFRPIVQLPLVPGGDPQRNADTAAGVPIPILRWHAELHESNQVKERLANHLKTKQQSIDGLPATTIPSRVAVSTGRSVICSTYDQRIVAIDLQTGLLQWECVYTGMPLGFSLEDLPSLASNESSAPNDLVPDHLLKRVLSEANFGNIATDGERLYGVSEHSSLEVFSAPVSPELARFGGGFTPKTNNVLQCWSIAEEGKLMWEIGGATSEQEPRLANTYFLGAPLPYRGELLVIAEINGEVNLVALAPTDGRLLWKQPLTQNEQVPVANDSLLRIVGASPTAEGNTILCPTLSGYLVAFDLHTRTLQWGLHYRQRPSNSVMSTGIFGSTQPGDYDPLVNRSVDLSPVVGAGLAVYAPPDGFGVQAIDIATGERRWQNLEGDRESVRYVGAITDKCVLVVCQNAIYGFNKSTGAPLWSPIGFGNEAQITGRGIRQGDLYYAPLSNQTLLQIDMSTGKSERSSVLDHVPGNLINVNDRLVSVSPLQMECYAIESAFKAKMATLGAPSPQSVSSYIDQGELELINGNIEAALLNLEQAYRLDPTNQDCWVRLRRAAIAAIQLDFDKYFPRVRELKIDLDQDPTYARSVTRSLLEQGKGLEAFEKLLVISDMSLPSRSVNSSKRNFFQSDANTTVQEDRWIRVQIKNAYGLIKDRDSNERFSQLIEQQKEGLAVLEPTVQRIKLNHFHSLPQFDSERVQLAERLIGSRLWVDAEQLLMDVFNDMPIGQWTAHNRAAAAALAKIYVASDRGGLISQMIGDDSAFGDQLFESSPSPDLSQLFPSDLAGTPLPLSRATIEMIRTNPQFTVADWPTTQVEVAVAPSKAQDRSLPRGQANPFLIETPTSPFVTVGEALKDCSIQYQVESGWVTFQTRDGFSDWKVKSSQKLFTSNRDSLRTLLIDSKVIFIGQNYLIAIDSLDLNHAYSREFLWSQSFQSPDSESPISREIHFNDRERNRNNAGSQAYWGLPRQNTEFQVIDATRSEIVLLIGDELIGLDPQNGLSLWRSSGFHNAKVAFDDSRLYCLTPSTNSLKTLDRQTGQLLHTSSTTNALPYCNVTGDHFFFADEKSSTIRLVNASTDEIVLDRTLSADFLLSFTEANDGFVALGNTGEYFYWNFRTGKEHNHRVALRNDELLVRTPRSRQYRPNMKQISLASFADRIVVLPYNSQFAYDNVEVSPGKSDGSYTLVSGSVFAISPEDGSPLWNKTVPVMQYAFPLAQDRRIAPFAVMVRRFNLSRLIGNQNFQAVGLGLIDLRSGEVVYAKDDNQGVHTPTFWQDIQWGSKLCTYGYSGVDFTVSWSSSAADANADQLGIFDFAEFRKMVADRFREPAQPAEDSDGSEALRIEEFAIPLE